jgi:hypothetical protein
VRLGSVRTFCICAILLLVLAPVATATTQFAAAFAPTDTFVRAPERSFRHDLCLNGAWQFQPVALPANFREGVDPAPQLPLPTTIAWEKMPVKVPSPWNVNSFANRRNEGGDFHTFPSYPAAWETIEMGWLRRSFRVPSDWKGDRLILHFAAAAGDIRVLINGKEAGTKFDLFFPFDLDITDLVRLGEDNEVLVGVRKASLFDVKGEYGRREYQAGSFWGQHIVGIWQDIDLLGVPAVRVSSTFVQPEVDENLLRTDVMLQNDTASDAKVNVSATVHRWISLADKGGVGASEPLWKLADHSDLRFKGESVVVPAHGAKTVRLEERVDSSLQLWSPNQPALYGLIVDVQSGSQLIDQKYQRFGWRQIKLKGSQILLNGEPIILKGDSWHFLGIPQMTRRYAYAWFSALHDAHLNAVRLHAEPYPEFYLDVADEMGILVLDETAIWASDGGPKLDSNNFWLDTKDHVAQLVLRDRNHPSVFGWSICNEVKPVIQGVFHGPPEMMQKLIDYYSIWAEICRRLDPTRQWISADGDQDGVGKLPVDMVHYGGTQSMVQAAKLGKPWGVGEASGAYYATPEQVAATNGERAYGSFENRMEGIAIEAYQNLLSQRKYSANYRSVFNLVWYGLRPLPLGMSDTSRPPELTDGVFFPPFEEGKPGVQPERIGPYSTTLNPGYDPALKPYETWPLFDAIKDANSDPVVKLPWTAQVTSSNDSRPALTTVHSIDILSGPKGSLRTQLSAAGVPSELLGHDDVPNLLFIDGRNPPDETARPIMERVESMGGTVVVWGLAQDTLSQLNRLLPEPIELTSRRSSSLLPVASSPVVAGLKPSDLYFSQSTPPIILDGGLGGRLVAQGTVLLEASNTDWLKWNKEAEYAKTAMVLRSEREAKPSGAALVEVKQGSGTLLITNLPAWSHVYKAQRMTRQLLANIGIGLAPQVDVGEPFLRTGNLVRTLAAGHFSNASTDELKASMDSTKAEKIRENDRIQDLRWISLTAETDGFKLTGPPLSNSPSNSVVYLSFWIQSPRSLDNLLIEPNVPRLDLDLNTKDSLQVFLNGKSVFNSPAKDGTAIAAGLPLQQGWNHFLIRLLHNTGDDMFSAHLVCSDTDFLNTLHSALQKP